MAERPLITSEDLDSLESEWAALHTRVAGASPFLHPAWHRAWLRNFGGTYSPVFLSVRRGEELVGAVALMLTGVGLLLTGISTLRGSRVGYWQWIPWAIGGVSVAWWFGVMHPHTRWRVGLLSALLTGLSWAIVVQARGERRSAYRDGMALLWGFGVIFGALMALRTCAALLGWLSSTVSYSMVNSAAVLAGGTALIGAVAGLALLLSGEMLELWQYQREHDPLTGLLNRQGLRSWVDALATDKPLTLAMIDLDHFKQLNDTHGHATGDQVIQALALELRRMESATCRAVRLGGEEFGILAANLDYQGTTEFAEIIRMEIENLKIRNQCNSSAQYLTVSIGSISRIPGKADTVDSFMSLADTRLYQAKELGRNRVVAGN